MIVGLGIDLASIARVERLLTRWGGRIEARVLTESEQSELPQGPRRAEWLAGRIAAKEAGMKALGVPSGVSWKHLEIVSARPGPPELRFHGVALDRANFLSVHRAFVSITHDAGVAAAVVVLDATG